MKKFLCVFIAVLMVLTLCACGKKNDRSKYDEGEAMDASDTAEYAKENEGDPYAQSEIGLHRAYKNLIVAMGTYDSKLLSYVRYEYVKDGVHDNKPCYIYSKKVSKEKDGEYKHHCYIAVYKDGSTIVADIDIS